MTYEIRIKGHLSPQRAEWFEGFMVTPEKNGVTLLTGTITDQAVMHGIFKKIRDLNLPLISVIPVPETTKHRH